jgi:hypothetical protein
MIEIRYDSDPLEGSSFHGFAGGVLLQISERMCDADFLKFNELSKTGLPRAYTPGSAILTLLNGTSVLSLPHEALMKALSTGVLMDGSALTELEAMGLGEHTGFTVRGTREFNTFEQFTHDPLNGRFGSYKRDCRPAFYPELT